MPSTSEAQARLMRAVAHGWHKPGGGGPSVSVAKEFAAADKTKAALRTAKKYAEGGEVNEWEDLPKSPEGRPQITVTPQPPPSPTDLISKYASKAADWFNPPSQIKPETPPAPEFNADPSQVVGNTVRGLGSGIAQHYRELVEPFEKTDDNKYVADQPIPEAPGKIPATQKDPISFGAPIVAEVASTLAGPPGQGMGWGLLKGAAVGAAGMAAKIGKTAARTGFMETAHFKPVSISKGTMPGGFKLDPATGTEWYVKQAPSLEQAKNEKLTAELYKLFGVPVADVHLTTVGGKPGIASKKIEGEQLGNWGIDYNEIPDLHENYPIHALLANHDAVGTGPENPLGNIIIDSKGRAHVIDTGGGLLYKGTGTKKAQFTPEVPELDTMKDPTYSHLSAEVFGDVDHQTAMAGAQKIANVSGEQIAKLVELYGPSDKMEKLNLLSTLLKRKHNIEQEFGVVPHGGPESKPFVTPVPRQEPVKDPYEQIPFTEDDYEKWAKEATPPPAPDDVMNHGRLTQEAKPTSLLQSSDQVAALLTSGKKFDKPILAKMTQFLSGEGAWNAAHYLWEIADSVNPQTAEALFRALPPKIQVDVGHRIAALKDSLEYSPWNSIAKGSGANGKYPSEYDFYTTKTTAFKPPASVLKDKKFMEDLHEYSGRIEGKEPGLPQQVAAKEEYSGIPAGYANAWLNAPKEASKLLEHFKIGPNNMVQDYNIKGIGAEIAKIAQDYPPYADAVYNKIPSHIKPAISLEYGNAKAALKKAAAAKESKAVEEGSFTFQEGRNKASYEKNSPIGIAFATKYLEPIQDWKSWTPKTEKITKPEFGSFLKEKLASLRGFNTRFEIYKGGHANQYDPHPESAAYPSSIPDPSSKTVEPAWFGAGLRGKAEQYGPVGGSYILGSKKAVEIDWQDYIGHPEWHPTPMHNAILAAKKAGADLLIVRNMHDPQSGWHIQYAVINPAILRGPDAKFDLKKLHLANPLAGLAGGGLFGYGAISAGQEQNKMNRGGIPALVHRAKTLARGGPGSAPWQTRAGSHPRHPAGMIKSSIPGRTDKIPMGVPPGSYILPADVPSALGEGNTMAGEKILGTMFKSGPYSPGASSFAGKQPKAKFAMPRLRGKADGGEVEDIPIIAAGGEYVIHPEQVAEIGHGDMKAGHKALDLFVLKVRKEHIRTLKTLKPPKK